MGTPLRVLIIEDSEDDTTLMLRELRRSGYEPTHERVDTAEAMTEALGREKWDVVLADYMMPRFSAVGALTLLKESGLDLPFIIVTGTVGEEIAVATMKAGAHDYLFKGNLARLVPAVERELREAESRRAHKLAEEALRESEERFRAVFEQAVDSILLIDADTGAMVEFNGRAHETLCYSREEFEKLKIADFEVIESAEDVAKHLEKVIREGSDTFETKQRTKSGEMLDVDVTCTAISVGGRDFVQSTWRDITARKRAEGALLISETRFRRLFEAAQDGILILDADTGQIVDVNPFLERLLAYSREEIQGKTLWEIGPFSDIAASKKAFSELKRRGYVRYEHLPLQAKDGRQLDVEFVSNVYKINHASVIQCNIRDISERKRAEEALRERDEWLSTTLGSIGDAVIATDTEGRITFLNPAAQSMTGWSQEKAAGKPLRDVFNIVDEETGRSVQDPVTRVMREGLVVSLGNHTVLIASDGARRPIDDSGALIRDSQGNVTGVVLVFHDISEQKRAAEDLRRLAASLLEVQEEDRRKVAYDIHDGLGQLMTAASMHLESFAAQRKAAGSREGEVEFNKAKSCLRDAVVEMRRMVSDLGPLLLEEVGLVEASRRLLADMAERRSWETEFEGDVDVERLDRMAEMALFRILQEALANAAKHSRATRVRIAFHREADLLSLEVCDWGKGFDVNRVLAQRGPGLHVGLLGMRERATLLGGDFGIESAPGKGTKLTVAVPVAPPEAPVIGRKKVEEGGMTEARKSRESARGGITVLIADDHPMVREGLRSMLDAEGIEIVAEAANGTQAVEGVQQFNPDVVLMDVRMPDMDGLAATEIVKEGSPETSVIVITSYESKDYLRRAIEVGAAGYLLKGMSRESLIDAIRLVRGGGSLIDARLLSELLREMGVEGSRFQGVEGALEALTPREREVLQLLVRGLTNKEIAVEMHYSVGTVKNVVQRVIEKLGVSDRTQAAVYAVRAGLNPPA